MDLIAGSQTSAPQFKSVTGEIMRKDFLFICLQAGALKTLGHYWYRPLSDNQKIRSAYGKSL